MFTVGELSAWFDTTVDEDAVMFELERAAVAAAELWTGHSYQPSAERTEYYRGTGTDTLFLKHTPVTAVATVEQFAAVGGTATLITEVDADGWVLRQGEKMVRKSGYPWWQGYEYRVTYTAGYASGTEPALVRQAVLGLIGLSYSTHPVIGPEEFQSETIGGIYSYTKASSNGSDAGSSAETILATLPRRLRV